MGRRDRIISASILRAVFNTDPSQDESATRVGLLVRVFAFFTLFNLALKRYRAQLFKGLREEAWKVDEEGYIESFRSPGKGSGLIAVGDLGYSGSTFFTTPNSKYLIKSLPRRFEQSFFRQRLLDPYVEHMQLQDESLLVRITDLLHCPSSTLGAILGTAPSHHIVMENILYGRSYCSESDKEKWETYDLKPDDYFYPERDIAGGVLVPKKVKERLIDEFHDKVRMTNDQKEQVVSQLSRDSKVLQDHNAVDYSLFIVRYPADLVTATGDSVPTPPGRASSWRKGLVSRDGKWIYRAVVLDFFFAKSSLHAHAFTGLVEAFNMFTWGKDHGPMSITTTAHEYRQRFLRMVDGYVEVLDSAGRPAGEVRSATFDANE